MRYYVLIRFRSVGKRNLNFGKKGQQLPLAFHLYAILAQLSHGPSSILREQLGTLAIHTLFLVEPQVIWVDSTYFLLNTGPQPGKRLVWLCPTVKICPRAPLKLKNVLSRLFNLYKKENVSLFIWGVMKGYLPSHLKVNTHISQKSNYIQKLR